MLDRRQFLQTSAAAALALSATQIQGISMADDQDDLGDIDCHSHVWTPNTDAYPLAKGLTADDLKPHSFTPEELLAIANPLGIKRVVLIQHTVYHVVDNTYITDTIQRFPKGIFSGVACLDAAKSGLEGQMNGLRQLGIRGMRIREGDGGVDRWSECAGMKAMWAHGPEIGIAMCPLINPEYLPEVDKMCSLYPETTVVVDHFARIGIDGTIHEKDLKNLVKLATHPHTHVKVSAYYALGKKEPPHHELIPMIRRLYDAYGPDRLMWGSDSPYQLTSPNTYADSVKLIREGIDFLTEDDKKSLMRGTAHKVFFAV